MKNNMASLSEIKEALKQDPKILNRIPGLKKFVEDHRDEFEFLFSDKSSKNQNANVAKTTTKKDASVPNSFTNFDPTQSNEPVKGRKWVPSIKPI